MDFLLIIAMIIGLTYAALIRSAIWVWFNEGNLVKSDKKISARLKKVFIIHIFVLMIIMLFLGVQHLFPEKDTQLSIFIIVWLILLVIVAKKSRHWWPK